MSLLELKDLQKAKIVNIKDVPVSYELSSYGISVSDILCLERKSLLNDPIQVICNSNIYSISKKDAKNIEVELV